MGSFDGRYHISNEFDGTPDLWRIDKDIAYISDGGYEITVKAGATTDGASIPKPLKFLFAQLSNPKISVPAAFHDQLYKTHGGGLFTQKQSDMIFREALQAAGVPDWKANMMYRGLRLAGFIAWNNKSHIAEQMIFLEISP